MRPCLSHEFKTRTGRDTQGSAKAYAVRLLSQREYSARVLSDKLLEVGYEREAVEVAVASMQECGPQSDERFAEMRLRQDGRRMGNRRAAASLVERGIAKELATEKLAALAPELERAVALAQRFTGEALDDRLRAKIWWFMAYRGLDRMRQRPRSAA